MFNKLRSQFLDLNLYDSHSTDPSVKIREIRSTRLFLLLFTISILILTTYTLFILRTKSETIEHPSLHRYNQLEQLYPNTLSCTCTKISILYNDFISVTPQFHQVCSSDFISQAWIDFTLGNNRATLWPMDVRTSLSFMWQLIATLCHQTKATLAMSVEDFELSPLISSTLFSRRLLESKVQEAIDNLRLLASDRLLRPLKTVHQITLINDYLTGVSTNHVVRAKQADETIKVDFSEVPSTQYLQINSTKACKCQSQGSCPIVGSLYLQEALDTQGFYDLNTIVADHIIPGLIVDCLPTQMMFASTLECFYNQSCVALLISSYSGTIEEIAILNENIPSRFAVTTKIEKLIDELFIETVINENNYSAYYAVCAPSLCSYTYTRRFDWIYTITTIMSLIGGLTVALKLISRCPFVLMELIGRKRNRQEKLTLKTKMNRLLQKGLKSIEELNLFTKKSRNPLKIRRGRFSSRLFVVLFTLILAIFTIYTVLLVQTFHDSVQSPTKDKYLELYNKYSDTLHCPCSNISITYQDIIEIHPTFHQLCMSSYVQPWWYQSLNIDDNNINVFISFTVVMTYLRTLEAFCDLSALITAESIRQFYATNYVNAHLISEEQFREETDIFVNHLQNSTRNNFFYTLELIKTIVQANQYIIGANYQNSVLCVIDMNMVGVFPLNTFRTITIDVNPFREAGTSCYCARRGICKDDDTDGFYLTCSLTNNPLARSWEDLYGADALEALRQDFRRENLTMPENTTLLDPTLHSRFPLNASFQAIVNELTIENWNPSASFQRFFDACRPISCSFTYQARPKFFLILSIIIGIIGGLNKLLRLICPFLVRLIIRTNEQDTSQSQNADVTIQHPRLHRMRRRFQHFITSLNLFDIESNDPQIIHMERISTWVYIALLTITLSIFTIYTALDTDIDIGRIAVSSLADYEQLANSSLRDLQCPCSQISVLYKQFISINTTIHQVCSSDFAQDPWLDFLFFNSMWFRYQRSDLRIRGAAYFGLLSPLCRLSQTVLNTSINQLLNKTFISSFVIPETDFLSKIQMILDGFIKVTPLTFASALQLINGVTHGNTFVSTYFLNWDWEAPTSPSMQQIAARPVVLNDGCSCATRSDCRTPGGVFDLYSDTNLFTIPGFYVGCSSVDTLLGSSLECFYDQECLNNLMFAMALQNGLNGSVDVHPLDVTIPSRYFINAPLKEMVESLMVEEWQRSVSYAAFYNHCAPQYCTYVVEIRDSNLTVLTKILGLYGGLVTALRLTVPFVTRQFWKKWNRRRTPTIVTVN